MNYKKISNVLMCISEDSFKKKYTVYGHFYCNDMGTEGRHPCRSVLEIVSKDIEVKPEDLPEKLSEMTPDAVVIMMNPGSSVPLEIIPCSDYNKDNIKEMEVNLVLTKPDTTQYQIMRVMCYQEWGHVRVINLSDLRNPESEKFIKKIKQIKSDQHSIFSDTRSKELKKKLKRKEDAPIICEEGVPIICAWGVDPGLKSLIAKARLAIKGSPIGYAKDPAKFQYYHAYSPEKMKEWLKEILEQLKNRKKASIME